MTDCRGHSIRPIPLRPTFLACLSLFLIAASSVKAQTPAAPPKQSAAPASTNARIIKTVESYLRTLYAWGPAYELKVGPLKDAAAPDLYEVPIQVTFQGQSESGVVYASKDGQFLIRGELYNTAKDPFADVRAKIPTDNSPSKGPADAKITVVEFSDFQCPHCRQLYETLKNLETKYPQVRIVFKNFPLEQLHPWAMTAALAAHCAYQHSPQAFWKVHDAIFSHQDLIDADNAWDKLSDFASDAGVSPDEFRACMADPATKQAVERDMQVGASLKIASTPTVYVNGRESIGGDAATLAQFIDFELLSATSVTPAHAK